MNTELAKRLNTVNTIAIVGSLILIAGLVYLSPALVDKPLSSPLETLAAISFWLVTGTITGLFSGWWQAQVFLSRRPGGDRFFRFMGGREGYLIGGILGVALAYLLFGGHYWGGLIYMIPLFLSWAPAESYFRTHLINKQQSQ